MAGWCDLAGVSDEIGGGRVGLKLAVAVASRLELSQAGPDATRSPLTQPSSSPVLLSGRGDLSSKRGTFAPQLILAPPAFHFPRFSDFSSRFYQQPLIKPRNFIFALLYAWPALPSSKMRSTN